MDEDRVTGAAKDFAGKAEGAFGEATGDSETQASGRIREAAGKAQNLYGQAKDAAAGFAKDAYENSGDTLRDSTQAVARKVQDNPLGALLVAGGIGFALALLMTRPPRRPPPPRWRYYS
ncbi:MAG TPA: CsbD family protein [Bradyrhizobium sp.]|nr:CsbD family protein [Bradyrhizobium sp.]